MDKHVIISGGSRGLGQALVAGLLQAGFSVSTFSRSATDFTRETSANERFNFAEADVSDPSQTGDFVKAAVEKLGAPYGLINCAGVARQPP